MGTFSSHYRYLKKGFTLIELIVVITIIGILFVGVAILFNPAAQLQKARNANRQQDLIQIKNALDAYYNDTGCYPTSLSFGTSWTSGATVYMKQIPEDPNCSSSNLTSCYDYQTDGSSCPQWNILYANMQQPIVTGIPSCSSVLAGCVPQNLSFNYCTISGKLDCSYVSSNPPPSPVPPGGSGGGGGGGGGGGSSTPTPLPTQFCYSSPLTGCSNGQCNNETGSNNCLGCGGNIQCYQDSNCGGNVCK